MKKFKTRTVRFAKRISVKKAARDHLVVKVTYNDGSAMIKRPKLR